MNKFSGERVYEDPTKDKKSLEEKNQANIIEFYWIYFLPCIT